MDELPKLIALLTLAALLPHVTGEISRREVESATAALRSNGYNLFGNSLTVSDLLFQVLSGEEFTFLSPPDTSLFTLGMSIDSFRYVHSLRLHVIPRRLSISDLRNLSLSQSPSANTLVPSHSLFLANRRRYSTSGDDSIAVVVNGIRISSPDIFLGPHIAVHGLDGTLAADMLPPEALQGDLGLGFSLPPAWPPSEEIPAPFPSTGPYPDLIPPPASPLVEVFSPDFKGSPIFPYPDLPPPIHMVPSPVSDPFANSPNLATGSFAPVGPPPSISVPPKIAEIPSPWNDQSSSGGTGQVGSSFRPNPSPVSSPSVDLPPRQAPISPPPVWGTPPPPYQTVWRKDPNQPWRKPKEGHESAKPKEGHESAKHRMSKKKRKFKKNHHHRKHKATKDCESEISNSLKIGPDL